MTLSASQKQSRIDGNRQQYGERYEQLHFPDPAEAAAAAERRGDLLAQLANGGAVTGCSDTKLDMAGLSPGCRACVDGKWSCLFINGVCNGSCFYCPTSQSEVGLPSTNTVCFTDPKDYVAYLERFGFHGASISGGEPLLTADTSIRFIREVKRHFGSRMHVWLYTNGILASREIMARLRDAGLDEIRFDIGATGYSLRQIRHAKGVIPTITVEIPAIPEEGERIKAMLPLMMEAGVQYCNLHQLRLTPHNFERVAARGYRFLHGEKVTVLDSELTALEILCHGKQNRIGLPVHYCSFPYKDRFQARAARLRNAPFIIKSHEATTGNGFIRSMALIADSQELLRCCAAFSDQGHDRSLWSLNSTQDRLALHPSLWVHRVEISSFSLLVQYSAACQQQAAGYRNPFVNVDISRKKRMVIERETHRPSFRLTGDQARVFAATFLAETARTDRSVTAAMEELPEEILDFEVTRAGLAEYY